MLSSVCLDVNALRVYLPTHCSQSQIFSQKLAFGSDPALIRVLQQKISLSTSQTLFSISLLYIYIIRCISAALRCFASSAPYYSAGSHDCVLGIINIYGR
jgi:hypothetical protein